MHFRNSSINTAYMDSYNAEHSFVTTSETLVTNNSVCSLMMISRYCRDISNPIHTDQSMARTMVHHPTYWN